MLLTSVCAQSELSAQRCEELWRDLEHQLNQELRQVESSMKMQLEAISAQLDKDGQVKKHLTVCLGTDPFCEVHHTHGFALLLSEHHLSLDVE